MFFNEWKYFFRCGCAYIAKESKKVGFLEQRFGIADGQFRLILVVKADQMYFFAVDSSLSIHLVKPCLGAGLIFFSYLSRRSAQW